MASMSFKTTDGVERTIGLSYIAGYDPARVVQAIGKIDTMLQTLGQCRRQLQDMASSSGNDSIRGNYLDYVYVSEYESALGERIKKIDSAIEDLTTARANLKLLNDKRQVLAVEIANNPLFS